MAFRTLTLCGLAALVFPVSLAFADTDTERREDDLIVTSTRLLTSEGTETVSVSVIDADDIERLALSNLADVLALSPGVSTTRNGGFGGFAALRLRGAPGEQTLVLIDGALVNDTTSPGGGYNFALVDTARIERIEVLRGPQSSLWGSDAIGGVVSITTRAPAVGQSARALVELGSFDTRRAAADANTSAALGGGTLSVSAGVSTLTTDGISKADARQGNSEKDGYQASSGDLKLKWSSLSGKASLTARLGVSDTLTDIDGFSATARGGVADSDQTDRYDEHSAGLTGVFETGAITHTLDAQAYRSERRSRTGNALDFSADGERDIYRWLADWQAGDRLQLVFGAEQETERAATFNPFSGPSGTLAATSNALFGVARWTSGPIILDAGLRRDDAEGLDAETTVRLGARWDLTDALAVRAAFGQGFKAPTLFQKTFICGFCGLTAPNPDLRLETAQAFEIGLDYRGGPLNLTATAFQTEIDDLIDFSFTQGYANIRAAEISGLEMGVTYAFGPALSVGASLTLLDTENLQTGARLARTPDIAASTEFIWTPNDLASLSLTIRHDGDKDDSLGRVDGFTRADLVARFAVRETLDLYVRAENLTDTAYQQVLGYGEPGRALTFGLSVRTP
jgi:vitamin B12 transporter